MDILLENGKNLRIHKELSINERKVLQKAFSGEIKSTSASTQEVLQRPHVAIAFEALLEKYNLSDDKLIKRLADIINRKAVTSESDKGVKSTNITTVDANAKDTIRMIWQAQGKFVERHQQVGELHNLADNELDSLIDSGLNFLLHKGKNTLNESTGITAGITGGRESTGT